MFLKLYSAYESSGDVDMQLLTQEMQGGSWILHFWQAPGVVSGPLITLWLEKIQTLPYFALINNAAVNIFVGALYKVQFYLWDKCIEVDFQAKRCMCPGNLIDMANCPSYDVHSASIV